MVNAHAPSSLTPLSRAHYPVRVPGFSPGIVEKKKIHMKPSLPLTRTPSLRRTTSPVRSTGTGRRMCPRTQVLDLALPDDAPENEHRTETARAARACPAQRGGRRCAPEGAPVRRTGQRRGDAASARLPAARSGSGWGGPGGAPAAHAPPAAVRWGTGAAQPPRVGPHAARYGASESRSPL